MLRYGLSGHQPRTLNEIDTIIGISGQGALVRIQAGLRALQTDARVRDLQGVDRAA